MQRLKLVGFGDKYCLESLVHLQKYQEGIVQMQVQQLLNFSSYKNKSISTRFRVYNLSIPRDITNIRMWKGFNENSLLYPIRIRTSCEAKYDFDDDNFLNWHVSTKMKLNILATSTRQ